MEKVGTYSYNGEANSVTIRFSDEEEDRTFTYDFEAELAYLSNFTQGFSLIEVKE